MPQRAASQARRRRLRPGAPHGEEAGGDPASRVSMLLRLQGSAGNRAATRMLAAHGPFPDLLRDTKPGKAPPARTTPGWTGADTTPGVVGKDDQVQDPTAVEGGWNAAAVLVGSIWRVPVEGLTSGNRQDFEEGERAKTDEPAAGRAIVLVHKDVDPKKPVSVLLHLHGYGFRSKPDDPYAGWRQFKTGKTPHKRSGTVRDVAHDRIQAQMTAVKNTQLIGVLPQGVGRSRFGGLESNPDGYVQEALGRAVAVLGGTKVLTEVPADRRLVLSAHSGGGDRVASTLAADRGGGARAGQPVEVVLFDAIHVNDSWDGVKAVLDWVEHHLRRTSKALSGAADDAARDAAVAACPVLRAYGSADYKSTYARLGRELGTLLGRFTFAGRDAEVKARFRVEILEKAGHEQIVRGLDADPAGGPLADALRAQGGPAGATAASKVTGAAAAGQKAQKALLRSPNPAFTQATTAGKAEDRAAVAEALAASGYPDPRVWFAGVDTGAAFLGMKISPSTGGVAGVHRRLQAPLAAAEKALLGRYPGKTADEVRKELGMYSISGLRLPLSASGREGIPSLHCFGLAVDINYAGSPFVGLQKAAVNKPQFVSSRTPRVIERAMWLLEGEAFDVEASMGLAPGPGTVTTAWKAHDRASKALARYLNLFKDLEGAELARLVAKAGEPKGVSWNQPSKPGWWNDLAWWKSRLTIDWSVKDLYDFHAQGHHGMAEKTGYMDLHQALVEELVNAGLLWGGQYAGAKDIMHFDLQGQITR